MPYIAKQTRQVFKGWDEFYTKPKDEKLDFFKRGADFSILFLPSNLTVLSWILFADCLKGYDNWLKRNGADQLRHLLPHKRCMLYFVQPSTPTFLSFLNACHILGLNVSKSRGTSTSSEVKGESQEIPSALLPAMWI